MGSMRESPMQCWIISSHISIGVLELAVSRSDMIARMHWTRSRVKLGSPSGHQSRFQNPEILYPRRLKQTYRFLHSVYNDIDTWYSARSHQLVLNNTPVTTTWTYVHELH